MAALGSVPPDGVPSEALGDVEGLLDDVLGVPESDTDGESLEAGAADDEAGVPLADEDGPDVAGAPCVVGAAHAARDAAATTQAAARRISRIARG